MARIILDFGSGNTCRNDLGIIRKMYNGLKLIDRLRHNVIVKWQLFEKAGDNLPLGWAAFDYAYTYGRNLGYAVTASAFDLPSLKFLLQYDIPFVKLANNKGVYHLAGGVPRNILILKSVSSPEEIDVPEHNTIKLACVSEYPATTEQYIKTFGDRRLKGISDHSSNFNLFRYYEPDIIEWHYKLEDSTGLDAGPFARTPAQLTEIL